MTNDDGIYSEGLWALARAVAPAGEVVVRLGQTRLIDNITLS